MNGITWPAVLASFGMVFLFEKGERHDPGGVDVLLIDPVCDLRSIGGRCLACVCED